MLSFFHMVTTGKPRYVIIYHAMHVDIPIATIVWFSNPFFRGDSWLHPVRHVSFTIRNQPCLKLSVFSGCCFMVIENCGDSFFCFFFSFWTASAPFNSIWYYSLKNVVYFIGFLWLLFILCLKSRIHNYFWNEPLSILGRVLRW